MDWRGFAVTFGTVFLAELGDKTQIATLLFATKSHRPFSVFLGSGLALITSSALAVLIGAVLGKALPTAVISRVAGGLFVVLGVLLILGKF